MADIVLVVMPFASINRPSIGVSLLKSALISRGFTVDVRYFNIDFAEKIGVDLYNQIADGQIFNTTFIGEWIFSGAAFDFPTTTNHAQNRHELPKEILSRLPQLSKRTIDHICYGRQIAEEFIFSCVRNIIETKAKLVGFSTVFQQNCPSIAAAKKLKEHNQSTTIIFGGANCEGQMGKGLLECCDSIDFVCSGEGDNSFIQFVESLFVNGKVEKINGIITRESSQLEISFTNPVMNMGNLPLPDYDDYFQRIKSSKIDLNEVALPVESSRGCWWGEIMQCTFCGLNGGTMSYRRKSVERFLQEIVFLSQKYHVNKILPVDNILDINYIDQLFPQIRGRGLNLEIFYETKANLTKKQLVTMKNGGVKSIQPGIESLDDEILGLMKKGVTAMHNIKLLKWCRELDIDPIWNFLWGFPKESAEVYSRLSKIIPLVVHLKPPLGLSRISIDRFSPYFMSPSQYGIINMYPNRLYKTIYPFDEITLGKIAYRFEYDEVNDYSDNIKEFSRHIANWMQLWDSQFIPSLVETTSGGDDVTVKDTRPCAVRKYHLLIGQEAILYKICGYLHEIESMYSALSRSTSASLDDFHRMLADLIHKKLVICINNKYINLGTSIDDVRETKFAKLPITQT